MAKNLSDNFENSRYVGTRVKLTPNDKTGTPEDFEKLFERRRAPKQAPATPRPKMREIEHTNMAERLEEYGIGQD
jgi:hypothetical protein